MNLDNPDVKIIRLNTGDDIIGNCLFDDENSTLIIDSPMKVSVQRSIDFGRASLVMMPWLPLEIIEENIVTIDYDDVLTTIIPKKSFIEFYANTLEKYEALVNESGGEVDPFADFEDDEGDDLDDEAIDALIEAMKQNKNRSIH